MGSQRDPKSHKKNRSHQRRPEEKIHAYGARITVSGGHGLASKRDWRDNV
jgi:hypothetical protein